MKLLAFDTALNACSVVVFDLCDGGTIVRSRAMSRGHAEALMPMIDGTMRDAGVRFPDIDRFAVTIGPGGFTGLRVGLAAGRGLALATGRPLVGVGTLHALAHSALSLLPSSHGSFMIVRDARRGEVQCQTFDEFGTPLDAPRTMLPAMAAAGITGSRPLLVGDGASLVIAELPTARVRQAICVDIDHVDPVRLASLAASLPVPDRLPGPLYLRPADAKPQNVGVTRINEGVAP